VTAGQAKRILDMLAIEPGKSATLIARTLNVSRPYVYDVARTAGYERVNKRWQTVNDTQVQNDLQYQMLSEIHTAVVKNRDNEGRVHVELPKPFEIVDGYMYIPVDPTPMTEKDVETWVKLGSNIATSTKPDGLKELMSWAVSRIMYRVNELDKD
jgi:hypothetical protein